MAGPERAGAGGGEAEAIRLLREMRARPDISQRHVDQLEKQLGWGASVGGSAQERVDAHLQRLERRGFQDPPPRGLVSLDGSGQRAPPRPSAFAEGLTRARTDLRAFYEATRGQEVHHPVPIGQGAVASAARGELSSGRKVIIRHVDDPALSVSLSNGSHVLAHQIGLDKSTFASAIAQEKGHDVMWMAHAPDGYVAADHAPERMALIPQEQRVLGALHDVLTSQDDRFPKNLMVDAHGHYGLVDPDWSWGNFNPWGWTPSLFYPGGDAGFSSPQRSFGELPARAQQTVQQIRASSPKQVRETYGVSMDQAIRLKRIADLVHQKGLAGAIDETVADRRRMYSTFERHNEDGFERRFEGTLARRGRRGAGYMVYGPYKAFPAGPVDVDFQLRLKGAVDPETTVATLDIWDDAIKRPLSAFDVKAKDLGKPGEWAHVKLGAELPPHNNMEFRVRWHGNADLDAGWISARVGRGFRAADRHGEGGFPTAGGVTSARQGSRGPGFMVYGPYQPFPAGHTDVDYQIRLKSRLDPETPVLSLDIYNKATETPLTTRVVKAKELDADGHWVDLRLGADLPAGNNMEFRVKWLGQGDVDVGTVFARR